MVEGFDQVLDRELGPLKIFCGYPVRHVIAATFPVVEHPEIGCCTLVELIVRDIGVVEDVIYCLQVGRV